MVVGVVPVGLAFVLIGVVVMVVGVLWRRRVTGRFSGAQFPDRRRDRSAPGLRDVPVIVGYLIAAWGLRVLAGLLALPLGVAVLIVAGFWVLALGIGASAVRVFRARSGGVEYPTGNGVVGQAVLLVCQVLLLAGLAFTGAGRV